MITTIAIVILIFTIVYITIFVAWKKLNIDLIDADKAMKETMSEISYEDIVEKLESKYKNVEMFWEYQGVAGRLQYLSREWHILKQFNINIIYQEWEDLEDGEKEIIYKKHKKEMHLSSYQ